MRLHVPAVPRPAAVPAAPVPAAPDPAAEDHATSGAIRSAGWRRGVGGVADLLGLAVVWFALVAPTEPTQLTPIALLRLPIEGLALLALALLAVRRAARVGAAVVAGVALGLLAVLEVLELAFVEVLDRPFNPVSDAAQLGPAVDFVRASSGPLAGTTAIVVAVLLAVAVVAGTPVVLGRAFRVVQRSRRRSGAVLLVLTVLWTGAALSGLRLGSHAPIASVDAARLVVRQAQDVSVAVRDRRAFDAAVRVDAHREPASGELVGLAGKDVLVVFVESYGRVAVEGAAAAGVRDVLDSASRQLEDSGYAARSAFLTSPTFGGVSWLAHSTLQSGVWVDTQSSYDRLLAGDRTTLTSAFGRAGWRTVALLPSNRGAWPQGSAFYRFDQVYDSSDLGYTGPRFGFSMMPDQFALQAFHRLELGNRPRDPVMAEVDLASSHGPWAPQPDLVAWDSLGDGSVFDRMHDEAEGYADLWRQRERVPGAYMTSIEYSLTALVQFVERYGSDRLVVVLVGDHQPASVVSGSGGNRDVPISIVARDPDVVDRLSPWGWQHGLRPDTRSPVWRMDTFRDRFLDAFSGRPATIEHTLVARARATP